MEYAYLDEKIQMHTLLFYNMSIHELPIDPT